MISNGNSKPQEQSQYRAQLLATFQNKGLEDLLKRQLRVKILEQLRNPHHGKATEQDSLFVRVVASLVSEYLIMRKLSYTNSVYLPDVGYEGKTLSRPELITLFTIDEDMIGQSTPLLEYFCGLQLPGSTPSCNQACQTNEFEVGYSMQERMDMIDHKHAYLQSRQPQPSNTLTTDTALLKKEIEFELKQHYDRQLRRFKQFDLESARLESSEKARKRFDEMKTRMEETYRQKCDDLRKRQRRFMDDHEQKVRQLQHQRSQRDDFIRKENQLLELRQRTCTEQSKLSSSERQVQLDKYRKMQDELQHKTQQYDRLNIKASQTIKYEVNLVKLAIQKEYQDKQLLTLQHKKAVDQQYYKMLSIKDSVQIIERQNNRLIEENQSLRRELQEQRHQNQELFDETKHNLQRVELSKQQKVELERQIMKLQSQLEKQTSRTQKLQHELSIARRQLDEARQTTEKLRQQIEEQDIDDSTPNMKVPIPTSDKKPSAADDLNKKMEQLRRQRKKQIEKMKLEMLS